MTVSADSADGGRCWSAAPAGAPLPRWSVSAGTTTAVLDRGPDGVLADALRELADRTGHTLSTIALAAHAKVVAAVTGAPEVLVAQVVDGQALPCHGVVPDGTWTDLLDAAAAAERAAARHTACCAAAPAPVASAVEVAEVAEAAEGWEPELVDSEGVPATRLRAGADGRIVLRHAEGAADAEHAARLLGYHHTVLTLMCRHAGRPGGQQAGHAVSLLAADERELQLTGLGGPTRELPDRRFHQLFEERVRQTPYRTAAVQAGRSWTYDELDRAANRIAHSLLRAGVSTEDVVAVVAERSLEWMACVLGVFKAGGTYLPIEPHFPAGRIEWMLDRARVHTVLVGDGCADAVPAAGPPTLPVAEQLADATTPDHAPAIPVGAGQAAYIYFTSGSTGEPKGAVCEHGGLLNHLLAKIEDLGLDEGTVVAQTAPQCFDISLWQLAAPLLAGGRTVIVEQEAILDVDRFIDVVADNRVEVLQIVPSYMGLLVARLENRPNALPHLRCVSATGEALSPALVAKWFACRPDTTLVNAYGLTETCDDTNHETLCAAPRDGRIPLGRPVNNVAVYVVDEELEPVPLGSTGEIVFSGVCVARGYVNDPQRTRRSFRPDPHRPGARLYRSGDYGRWLPGGKLEFRGRRDAQVKINGFRIEIGEVESKLLALAEVRDGAVVVAGGGATGGEQSLVAFCTGSAAAPDVRRVLTGVLPPYMVPAVVHVLDELPVNPNGKIDRPALARAAGAQPVPAAAAEPLLDGRQAWLAGIWADVLGSPVTAIGPDTDFFGAGGTSLSALRLVVALDRAVTLPEIREHPVLADLAELLEARLRGPRPEPALIG